MRIPFFFIRVFLKAFASLVVDYYATLAKDLFCFVYAAPGQIRLLVIIAGSLIKFFTGGERKALDPSPTIIPKCFANRRGDSRIARKLFALNTRLFSTEVTS